MTRLRIILILVGVLSALASNAAGTARADSASAAICSEKVRQFIHEMDRLLSLNQNDMLVLDAPIKKYLPVKGCSIDGVILLSKESRFFFELYEWHAAYTISFRSSRFIVSFSLRKDTGNIEYPAARTRMY